MAEAFPYATNSISENVEPIPYVAFTGTNKKLFKRRWYILIVYGFLCGLQGLIWNMWGPIFDSMHFIYGWSNRQIALLPFYGTLIFSLLVIPSALFLEKWGLRKLILTMSGLVALCSVIKCIPGPDLMVTIFVNISAVINGFAGSVVFFVPPYISAHWFSANERRLATAIGTSLAGLGVSLAFIVGPSFVSEPGDNALSVDTVKKQYFLYMDVLAVVACVIFIAVICYFPSKPPMPPTDSALMKRLDFYAGFKQLMVNKDYWCLSISSFLILGTFGGWGPVLAIDLARQDVDEDAAGWMGFYTSLTGFPASLIVTAIAEKTGQMKAILIALTFLSIEGSVWLLLVLHGYVAFTLRSVYIAAIIASAATSSTWAIRFEFAAEICYPIDEALSVGFLGLIINVWMSVFFSGLFFNVTTTWIDWCLAICTILSLPFLILTKESYKRSALDNTSKEENVLTDE